MCFSRYGMGVDLRDVKNEGCSSEFIENKEAKKSAPQELMKTKRLSYFQDESLKGKEIGVGSEVERQIVRFLPPHDANENEGFTPFSPQC
jgi:hypothetical protein